MSSDGNSMDNVMENGIGNGTDNSNDTGAKNDEDNSRKEPEYFYRDFSVGDFEVTFNFKRMKSPIDILEKLQQLHENEGLSNEEKNKIVQKIINDYME